MSVRAFAPGRTELAGNHTDHQGGRVIAAALDCGVRVEACANGSGRARVESEGFAPVDIAVDDVAPRADERFTTAALVRGVVAGLREAGVPVGGFDVQVESDVPAGSGLSSSAAFEVALARAACGLFGDQTLTGSLSAQVKSPPAPEPARAGAFDFDDALLFGTKSNAPARAGSGAGGLLTWADSDPVSVWLARICQRAEREWFGKACGLMDQLAVALGGIVAIDLAGDEPRIERIDFDFERAGYALCLIDAHCDHSLYTREYSQVPLDMGAVAEMLGARVLSQVPEEEFFGRFGEVREALGDMPALRALHYYHETRLVDGRARALREGDVGAFLRFTRMSGASSAQYLQNVSTFDRASQPAMVALALAERFLGGEGAARIHGGGFGGSIQAFVPAGRVGAFTSQIDALLGEGSCRVYHVG